MLKLVLVLYQFVRVRNHLEEDVYNKSIISCSKHYRQIIPTYPYRPISMAVGSSDAAILSAHDALRRTSSVPEFNSFTKGSTPLFSLSCNRSQIKYSLPHFTVGSTFTKKFNQRF